MRNFLGLVAQYRGRKNSQILHEIRFKTDIQTIIDFFSLFQVEDNHVVKYIPPEEFAETIVGQKRSIPRITGKNKHIHLGCLVVGALSTDPQKFTKDYCGLFTESGVMPKKLLARFPVTPNALIQPGTPLNAAHFEPGQFIDATARVSRRGFQGGMKRHGFSGMPSDARGCTKSHRRIGE